jgi:hypothetical protein
VGKQLLQGAQPASRRADADDRIARWRATQVWSILQTFAGR